MPIKLNREIIFKSDAKYEIVITASDFFVLDCYKNGRTANLVQGDFVS